MRDSRFMRGQIWWMEGYEVHKEGGKRRPALIISNDIINSNMCNENITVIPLTTNTERATMRSNVIITRYNRVMSVAKCAEVVTIYKNQLVCYDSTVDEEIMKKIEEAVRFGLGMEDFIPPQVIIPQDWSKVAPADLLEEKEESKEKEEKFDDPVLSSLTDNDREYIELMETEVKKRTFLLRRGFSYEWEEKNPVLFFGEPGVSYNVDNENNITGYELKIGDGVKAWSELSSIGIGSNIVITE
jgi:mRNA-degrading endonuclease toxin of MazEF toxin-antitoxin module